MPATTSRPAYDLRMPRADEDGHRDPARDDLAQHVQLAMEEVLAARDHDDRDLARRGPGDRVGERHGLVEVAVHDDGVGARCGGRSRRGSGSFGIGRRRPCRASVMRRKPGRDEHELREVHARRSRARRPRRRRRIPRATAAAPPRAARACSITRDHVVGLAAALVVHAFGRAHAAEVEAEGRRARFDERALERGDDLVVHRAAEERMRMRDDGDARAATRGACGGALRSAPAAPSISVRRCGHGHR